MSTFSDNVHTSTVISFWSGLESGSSSRFDQNLRAQCLWTSCKSQTLGATFPQRCPHGHPNSVPRSQYYQPRSNTAVPKHCRVLQCSTCHCPFPDVHPLPSRKVLVAVLCCMIRGSELSFWHQERRENAGPPVEVVVWQTMLQIRLPPRHPVVDQRVQPDRWAHQTAGRQECSDLPRTLTCTASTPPRCGYTSTPAKTSSSESDPTKRATTLFMSKLRIH